MSYTNINKGSLHFNTKLYAGTGSTNAITGVNFQPDLTWIKQRNGSTNNMLVDAVRGVTKTLVSNTTVTEDTDANSLTAFGTDGFTVGSTGAFNASGGSNYVSWNWKAGGTGSANSVGTINSTVSVNTTAGFSIVTYTGNGVSGATVGHGLGVAPKMIMIKCRNTAHDWAVYHKNLTSNNYYLVLNTTAAEASDTAKWQNTDPSSTVFTLGNGGGVNANTQTHVAYCFAEKKGYSKFGTYTGNGYADGAFIYTGFKPSIIFQKRTNSTSNWHFFDIAREPINPMNKYILANDSSAEGTAGSWDFLSNGFKIRSAENWQNKSGGTYIYMAFAEEPLVANVGAGIPATAR